MRFRDRTDAGRQLAGLLEGWRERDPVVLALPRGGVPVAAEVATALDAPLDVVVVRKLGHPRQPELALGALGEGGVIVHNDDLMARTNPDPAALAEVAEAEQQELARRVERYRGGREATTVEGRPVIVVDDGLATGATARAACQVVRRLGASSVTLAVPVAPSDAVAVMDAVADDVVCVDTPRNFGAIGSFYDDFTQVPDAAVIAILASHRG